MNCRTMVPAIVEKNLPFCTHSIFHSQQTQVLSPFDQSRAGCRELPSLLPTLTPTLTLGYSLAIPEPE